MKNFFLGEQKIFAEKIKNYFFNFSSSDARRKSVWKLFSVTRENKIKFQKKKFYAEKTFLKIYL